MDELEFDKTRKAIKAHELSEEERKKLLQTFVEKGGKVLQEKSIKKNLENQPKLSPQHQKKGYDDRKLPSQILKEEKLKEAERLAKEKVTKESILEKASSPLAIFSLKMQLWFKGITYFNKEILKPSFLSFLNLDFKKSILECNILATEFLSDPKYMEVFKKTYTPLYLELLKRVYLLYDRNLLNSLTASQINSEESVPIEIIRIPVFHFLKKLYCLKPFGELTLKLLLDSIDIQQNIQKKPSDIYKNKKKRIQESWDVLMYNAFPKFVLIAQYLEKKKLEPFTDLFEEMIDVKIDDKIDPKRYQDFKDVNLESLGKLVSSNTDQQEQKKTTNQQENIQQTAIQESEQKDDAAKREEIHNKIYQFGLRIINLYTLRQLKAMYDPKDEFKFNDFRDKVWIAYLLLNFFDDQFGFIFLTNKIQINTFMQGGVRVNLKNDMSILYESFRKIYGQFKKYYQDYLEYQKIQNDELSNKNSLDYQKKLDYFVNRRKSAAKETYKIMLEYITKSRQILLILFKDLREKNQYILNPEDVVELEIDESKRKLMHKRKVKEIIRDAYATAYTIAYKMEQGELTLKELELTEEEFQTHFGNI